MNDPTVIDNCPVRKTTESINTTEDVSQNAITEDAVRIASLAGEQSVHGLLAGLRQGDVGLQSAAGGGVVALLRAAPEEARELFERRHPVRCHVAPQALALSAPKRQQSATS